MNRTRETGEVGYRAYKKNLIGNGNFDIWQRGTTFSAVNGFTADRWRYTNANHNGVRSLDVPNGSTYSYSETAALGALPNLRTGIELGAAGRAGLFYVGNTFTLSFYSKGDIQDLLLDVQFRDTINANTNQVVIVSDGALGSNDADWKKYTYTFTVGASPVATNVALSVVIKGTVPDSNFLLAQVQIEEGSSATAFEYVSPQENLAACQRYYWAGLQTGGNGYYYSAAGVTSMVAAFVAFPVTMRVPTPTINVSGESYTGCISNVLSSNANGLQHRVNVTDNGRFRVSGGTYTADAEL